MISRQLAGAEQRIEAFSRRFGWERACSPPLFERLEICPCQATLWLRIKELEGLDSSAALPTDGLAAGLCKGVLLAIPASEFMRIRPEYARDGEAWSRLLAHELAHELHLRILKGDANAMGPQWFYEGFAIYAAGQDLGGGPAIATFDEALAAMGAEGRGAYAQFAQAFCFITGFLPLPELVSQAGRCDFTAWLKSVIEKKLSQ
jgi:hypothetical protein